MNLETFQKHLANYELDDRFRDLLCGWLGLIYIADASKESIVAGLIAAYLQGRRDGQAAAEYKPDGEK